MPFSWGASEALFERLERVFKPEPNTLRRLVFMRTCSEIGVDGVNHVGIGRWLMSNCTSMPASNDLREAIKRVSG